MKKRLEVEIPGGVPLSRSAPKVNGVSYGLRPILHPSSVENFSSFFV